MYVFAPVPFNVTEPPAQIVSSFPSTIGSGLIVTSNVALAKHTRSGVVYVTVYVAGVEAARFICPVTEFKEIPGVELKVPPGSPVITGVGFAASIQ